MRLGQDLLQLSHVRIIKTYSYLLHMTYCPRNVRQQTRGAWQDEPLPNLYSVSPRGFRSLGDFDRS